MENHFFVLMTYIFLYFFGLMYNLCSCKVSSAKLFSWGNWSDCYALTGPCCSSLEWQIIQVNLLVQFFFLIIVIIYASGDTEDGNAKDSAGETIITCCSNSCHDFMSKEEERWCHFLGGFERSHRWVCKCINGGTQNLFFKDHQKGSSPLSMLRVPICVKLLFIFYLYSISYWMIYAGFSDVWYVKSCSRKEC